MTMARAFYPGNRKHKDHKQYAEAHAQRRFGERFRENLNRREFDEIIENLKRRQRGTYQLINLDDKELLALVNIKGIDVIAPFDFKLDTVPTFYDSRKLLKHTSTQILKIASDMRESIGNMTAKEAKRVFYELKKQSNTPQFVRYDIRDGIFHIVCEVAQGDLGTEVGRLKAEVVEETVEKEVIF